MSSIDLSRYGTDPRKRYTGIRMQQGRVLTDDDFNEASRLSEESLRRTRLETIGPFGSPDAGFLPQNPQAEASSGRLNFEITPGTLYLGGLRLDLDTTEPFLQQGDWLDFDPVRDSPAAPVNGQTRVDLAWVEAWQQPVTALEDAELLEVALGGPDTSTRIRTMRRVHLLPDVGTELCSEAWQKACASWNTDGSLAPDMELATTARLSVSFTEEHLSGNLCSPDTAGGYLGAENQAIRVQAVSATEYTWGFDNATPLYRAFLMSAKDGATIKLQLLTLPKDAVHWPLKGQVVELLPWAAQLANGERLAAMSGFLAKVDSSFDPVSQTLTVREVDPLPASFASLTDQHHFFCLRVWNRGEEQSAKRLPLTNGKLGNTGLVVTFSGGAPRAGDHWIIAARPAAPDVVVPWQLDSQRNSGGAPPQGIKRYRAPLALIRWQNKGGVVTGTVLRDCRATYVPLTSRWWAGGCSVVVMPSPGWERIFLLFKQGQDVSLCFQPGEYALDHTVVLDRFNSVKMTGAGAGTRIRVTGHETAFLFADCGSATVRDLSVEASRTVTGKQTGEKHLNGVLTFSGCAEVRVTDCTLRCADASARQQSCLTVQASASGTPESVRIEGNRLLVGAWQIGLLLLDGGCITVNGNTLALAEADEQTSQLQTIPSFLVGTFAHMVKEALSPVAIVGRTQKVSFAKSSAQLHLLGMAAATPMVRDFAEWAPKAVAKAPGGVEGALGKFAREVAVGRHYAALSPAGKATVGALIRLLRAGGQGIVIGGARAGTVRISENLVKDMIQGIHVGVSTPKIQGPEIIDELVMSGNVVHCLVPRLFDRERHGVFVGNCKSTQVTATVASLRRTGSMDKKARATPVEGIRVHGILGPYLVIGQSKLEDFPVGISVTPLGPLPPQKLWLVTETLALGATKTLVAPTSVEGERNRP